MAATLKLIPVLGSAKSVRSRMGIIPMHPRQLVILGRPVVLSLSFFKALDFHLPHTLNNQKR